MKFTHNAIETKDIDKTIEFYTDFCEMRIVKDRHDPTTQPDFNRRVVWMAPVAEESPLLVIIEEPQMKRREDSWARHLGFETGSRDKVGFLYQKALNRDDCEVTIPEDHGETIGYLFLMTDPDGRIVEFTAGQKVGPEGWDK
jgi:catechol 2,3-dioxygenase-like lactoylglutathione lyase family enzyme